MKDIAAIKLNLSIVESKLFENVLDKIFLSRKEDHSISDLKALYEHNKTLRRGVEIMMGRIQNILPGITAPEQKTTVNGIFNMLNTCYDNLFDNMALIEHSISAYKELNVGKV